MRLALVGTNTVRLTPRLGNGTSLLSKDEQEILNLVNEKAPEQLLSQLRLLFDSHTILSGKLLECALDVQGADDCVQTLLEYPHFDCSCGFPLLAAVRNGASEDILRSLLRLQSLNACDGSPLRAAILAEKHAAASLILSEGRVNFSLDDALFHAVRTGSLEVVSELLGNSSTQVNRYARSYAMTPLCASILLGHHRIFVCLLSFPGIDVNKGLFWTPLQWCIYYRRTEFARSLLDCPTLLINKTLGHCLAPMEMAYRRGALEILELLLEDRRTEIPDSVVDAMEENEDIGLLQQIASTHGTRMGNRWMRRFYVFLVSVIFAACSSLVEMRLLTDLYQFGGTLECLGFVGSHVLACIAGLGYLFHRRRGSILHLLARSVPFLRLLDIILFAETVHSVAGDYPDLSAREKLFTMAYHHRCADSVFTSLPIATIITVDLILQLHPSFLPALIVCLVCNAVALLNLVQWWRCARCSGGTMRHRRRTAERLLSAAAGDEEEMEAVVL